MANQQAISVQRYKHTLKRAFTRLWGPNYVPFQTATIGAAPSDPIPGDVFSVLLQRRLHRMSRAEKPYIALALYHPRLFDLKDQFAMDMEGAPHLLAGHPKADGLLLPGTTGTLEVADRLRLIRSHPRIGVKEDSAAKASMWPWPLFGDLLLFLTDEQGPYCIDWDVKRHAGEHGKPGPGSFFERESSGVMAGAEARWLIHLEYMREHVIRVVPVAFEQLDTILVHNLQRLLKIHSQPVELGATCCGDVLGAFQRALASGQPPNEVIDALARQKIDPDQAFRVLHHAIWYRHLRVDLYQPLVVDRPLEPQVRDPLVELAHLFRRAD